MQATTIVGYGGRRYGVGMQFDADPEDAKALVKTNQAVEAPTKRGGAVVVATTTEFSTPANDSIAAKAGAIK